MDERLNSIPCGFISLTEDGIIKSANQYFLNLLDYSEDQLIDTHIESVMSVSNKFFFHTYFYPYIRLYGHVDEMFLSLKSRNNESKPVLLYGKNFISNNTKEIYCIFVHIPKRIQYEKEIRTISVEIEDSYIAKDNAVKQLNGLLKDIEDKNNELMEMNDRLEMMATTDILTGLRNRQILNPSLSDNVEDFYSHNVPFSVFMIDIDFFKKVNDTWGHDVGDRVLMMFAQIMKFTCRNEDVIIRYGGEEFVVILPNIGVEKSLKAAEVLRSTVEYNEWGICPITISIGIDTFTKDSNEALMIKNADLALYASKNNGRNCVTHALSLK